jgi:hypothetical protein
MVDSQKQPHYHQCGKSSKKPDAWNSATQLHRDYVASIPKINMLLALVREALVHELIASGHDKQAAEKIIDETMIGLLTTAQPKHLQSIEAEANWFFQ